PISPQRNRPPRRAGPTSAPTSGLSTSFTSGTSRIPAPSTGHGGAFSPTTGPAGTGLGPSRSCKRAPRRKRGSRRRRRRASAPPRARATATPPQPPPGQAPGQAPGHATAGQAPGQAPAAHATPATPPPADAELSKLRGAAARTAQNMAASLSVPTATSVRAVP